VISDRETSIEARIARAEYLLARSNVTDLGPSLAGVNANEVVETANNEWCRQQTLSGPAVDEVAPASVKSSTSEATQDQAKSGQTALEQDVALASDLNVTGQTGNSGDDVNISIDMTYDEASNKESTYVLHSNADAQRQAVVEGGEPPVVKLPRVREEDAPVSDSIVRAQQTSQAASAAPRAATDDNAEKSVDSMATAPVGAAVNMSGLHPPQKIQSCVRFWIKRDCAGDTCGKSHK
jgi:hypothetical protein